MNYEEKYKSALEWMRSIYPTMQGADKEDAEHYFPELRESKDERIRKEILNHFNRILCGEDVEFPPQDSIDKWIAWLEKQGKTSWKPDKEEMDVLYGLAYITNKFDEGKDKVITRLYQDLKRVFFNGASFENMFPANTSTEFEKQGEQKPTPKFKIGDTIHKIGENTVFPRTIEKIEDGDYVCNNSHSFVNIKFQDDYELVEQKYSWSEEDEGMFLMCSDAIAAACAAEYYTTEEMNKMQNWLKSIKPHWKPSEEQMQALFEAKLASTKNREYFLGLLYEDLKKL